MSHKYVYLFNEGNASMRNLLGGKGANLAEMTGLGLPVPYGFTVSTEACTRYYEDGRTINDEIVEQIKAALAITEEKAGKKFGSVENLIELRLFDFHNDVGEHLDEAAIAVVCKALVAGEAGESDDAFRTLTNPEIGWMQQIREGATTVWENWTPDASLNHYSKGACCQWLFDTLCGVKLDGRENHFVIELHTVGQLERISLAYDSVYGAVESGWSREGEAVTYNITIPANCSATLCLPGKEAEEISAGTYSFTQEGRSGT